MIASYAFSFLFVTYTPIIGRKKDTVNALKNLVFPYHQGKPLTEQSQGS
ncbi:hypothetical protein SeseC_01656 [Streptococcus equi subsp. zooepidemicus ATCC 35246]|nr:hypothetical protein SeseC_01656 [Streptococcus equi subsp. zooepidemicus ATCC 35246]